MKIAVFGRTQWLYDSAREVTERGHQVVLIGTSAAAPEYSADEDDFAQLADDLGCPYFSSAGINRERYVRVARDSGAEVAISVNWQTMIGNTMLDVFEHGVINAHCGDLPRFRGNATPNWAILIGEKKIVLTLHRMASDLDSGPILSQLEYPLGDDTYIGDIYRFMSENIPTMFADLLDCLASGTVIPRRQSTDNAVSLRCFPRLPRDGEIDWQQPAEELTRLVRASSDPFPGAYTYIGTERISILRAHPESLLYPYLGVAGQVVEIRSDSGEVAVLTQQGTLVLEEISTSSAGRVLPSNLISSTRVRLGLDLAQELHNANSRIEALEARLRGLLD